MCVEITNKMAVADINNNNSSSPKNISNKKVSYSVKKLLKKIFKQTQTEKSIIAQNLENQKKAASLDSLESLENSRNADIESVCASIETYENDANERLSASHDMEDYDLSELPTVPVHFVRTEHGTFFWTAVADIPADNDLIQPLYCSTFNEIAVAQFQDRWAQA